MTSLSEKPQDIGLRMLRSILDEAFDQCSSGKGSARHGNGRSLLEQPWHSIATAVGPAFLTGQATKKLMEAGALRQRLHGNLDVDDRAYESYERELLGAIVYSAFAIMWERNRRADE